MMIFEAFAFKMHLVEPVKLKMMNPIEIVEQLTVLRRFLVLVEPAFHGKGLAQDKTGLEVKKGDGTYHLILVGRYAASSTSRFNKW